MDSSGFFSGTGFNEEKKLTEQESLRERDDFMKQSGKLKPVLIQAIEEVVNELETTHEDVARGAREHIHSA